MLNFDIIIIGGSFAGMTSALALSNVSPDLKIAIIEKQDILNHNRKRDGRAYAISSASLKLFREIGIAEETQKHSGKIADIKITDYKSPFVLDFIGLEVDEKNGQLGQIIENYHIHNALRDQIILRKNIKVFAPNFYKKIEFGEQILKQVQDDDVGSAEFKQKLRHLQDGDAGSAEVKQKLHHLQDEDAGSDEVKQKIRHAQDDDVGSAEFKQKLHHLQDEDAGSAEVKQAFRKVQDDDVVSSELPHRHPELVSGSVFVTLDNDEVLNGKLLLACDGRFSKLREVYQIPTAQKNYQQTAIVFNISHQRSHQNIAYEKFLPGGPLAILPMKDLHQSSIVWISKDADARAILSLDEKNFLQQLNKKMENSLGEISLISEKFSYPLILIEAKNFYHEKMLLIGDASCGVHPIAGQGFNLAISGIKILCELVQKNLFSGLDIASENLIHDYNKKAKSGAKKMLIATDILNSLFETKSLSISAARDLGLGLVNKFPRLKKFFIKSAGGF